MFQYYLYEMIGTLVGVGTILKTEMIIHHIATMALISLSYRINLLRYGTMWMALFDLRYKVHQADLLN
jgi:ceramide synthetase